MDKLAKIAIIYLTLEYEDMIEYSLDGKVLIAQKQYFCQEISLIIFSFLLHNEQVDAIRMLFLEQKNLLLFKKTSFGKSLIFQLLLFLSLVIELIIILILLKLL